MTKKSVMEDPKKLVGYIWIVTTVLMVLNFLSPLIGVDRDPAQVGAFMAVSTIAGGIYVAVPAKERIERYRGREGDGE